MRGEERSRLESAEEAAGLLGGLLILGDYYQTIVDTEATADEAAALAGRVRDWLIAEGVVRAELTDCVLGGDGSGHTPGAGWRRAVVRPNDDRFLKLRTRGLKIVVGRTVFYTNYGPATATCPRCRASESLDRGSSLIEAIGDWYETGEALAPCAAGDERIRLVDWQIDPSWGFGYLGFEFWNWPPLSEAFVARVDGLLGHRTLLVCGKL
jgi:hypothetical protein